MRMFTRLCEYSVLAGLAAGLLIPSPPTAAADAFVLHQKLPKLQSLVAHASAPSTATAVAAEPICDIFANGYDMPGATPCAGCFDMTVDFNETDVDCGGTDCKTCADGQQCILNDDCTSTSCNTSTHVCAPATCVDGTPDGNETDVDCGGSCDACATGKHCMVSADCQSGSCVNNTCADVVLISQVQTRGDAGGGDEFVELYNPTGISVSFDSNWTLQARSATGGLATCATTALGTRFTGSGQVIPPHGHLLFVNSVYNGATPGDATYTTGITDASSVVLEYGSSVVDALCFYYDANTQATLTGCSVAYVCEGTPILGPHDNTTGTDVDASLDRKPGGAAGNMTDIGDNASDFFINSTPDPHNASSSPTP